MPRNHVATTTISVEFEGFEHAFDARITFQVTPARPQSYAEPAEDASVEITTLEVKLGERWHKADPVLCDMILAHTATDDIDAWLLKEAAEADDAARDDAADHARQMRREATL